MGRRAVAVLGFLLVVAAVAPFAVEPLRTQYYLRQARAAATAQDFPRATEYANLAAANRPESIPTRLLAAQCARRAGRLAEAQVHLNACPPEEAAWELRLLRAQEGRLTDVEAALQHDLDGGHPERVALLEALAAGYVAVGRFDDAQRTLSILFKEDPKNVVGMVARGLLREQAGKPDEAADDYRAVLGRAPDHDDARRRLAELSLASRPDESLVHIDRLLARHPGDGDLNVARAVCLKALLRSDEAAERLDAVLADQPNHFGALVERGLLDVQAGRAARGEPLLRRALALRPAAEDVHYSLYLCLRQQAGREAEATQQREAWRRAQADAARLHELTTTLGDKTMADADLLLELGQLLGKAGKGDLARSMLTRALELRPGHEPTRRALAEVERPPP